MFTYCLNNPVMCCDPVGNMSIANYHDDTDLSNGVDLDFFGGGGACNTSSKAYGAAVGVAAVVVFTPSLGLLLDNLAHSFAKHTPEIYSFAQSLIDATVSMYDNKQPRVHHVIPIGNFSRYGDETVAQLDYMHDLLISADISINDPENLIILSHGTHKSMHTKTYINSIYNIMRTATRGDEDSIRWALLLARTYAASLDSYSSGY